MSCPACERLERIRSGSDPFFLAELRESFALLHKHQPLPGWCTLWLKDHHEQLGLLPRQRQARLAEDVADVAAAMHRALPGLRRINYECLGNVVAHVHWHLIPRYDRPLDPDPGATVWVRPGAEIECGVEDALRDNLVSRLLGALGTERTA
jgi:diadenosine tetraphosphate (Ap4A) HIT family hydrolase